jgi:hypothetical protein
MRFRHAAALATVGWYLMVPPNACDLSSACTGSSIFWSAVESFRSQTPSNRQSEFVWRDRLNNELVFDAPLSKWHQIGEFETLAECRSRYNENLKPLPHEQEQALNSAKMELNDEGETNPSNDELQSRARLIEGFINDQALQGKCVASDDPRLAK